MDLQSGEVLREERLEHEGDEVRNFYQGWGEPVTVAIEATGYTLWFARLLQELGHHLVAGDAARLRALEPRKQKTDRRDALLLASVYASGRYPVIWMPDEARRDLRHLLLHRHRLVRTRTQVKNHLHALAMNHGLCRKRALFTTAGRVRLEALPMARFEGWRRSELLELLDMLNGKVLAVDQELNRQLEAWPEAQRLMTHPGVGPVTALAWVGFIGDVGRFAASRQLCSYLGLIPREASSGGRQHLGPITKQGNAFLRFLLVEAAQTAVRGDAQLARCYRRLAVSKGRPRAKVAVAHKLAKRLYWMSRRSVGYSALMEVGNMQAGSSGTLA
jgi:transposase